MPHDKLIHGLAGYAVALTFAPLGPAWAMGIVAFAAVLKEAWDASGRGTVDTADLLATIAGGAVGALYAGL